MLKETNNLEMVMLGNEDFLKQVKGVTFNKKLHEIKQVHEEIKQIEGKGLYTVLVLDGKVKTYIEKCQAHGIDVQAAGTSGIAVSLPEDVNYSEINEKVAMINKIFYEIKAEKAKKMLS